MSLESFDESEIIDIINLYRVLSEVIDKAFVDKFSRKKWIEYLTFKFKQQRQTKKSKKLITRKEIKWSSREMLNITLDEEEVDKIYEGVV